eukprot:3062113-Amphidinium_carterae.1
MAQHDSGVGPLDFENCTVGEPDESEEHTESDASTTDAPLQNLEEQWKARFSPRALKLFSKQLAKQNKVIWKSLDSIPVTAEGFAHKE